MNYSASRGGRDARCNPRPPSEFFVAAVVAGMLEGADARVVRGGFKDLQLVQGFYRSDIHADSH